MINAQSYMAKIKHKMKTLREKNKNFVDVNMIKMIMFEKFVERVNVSKYKDDIIFKGGFILAHKFNIINRTSGDLDYIFKLREKGNNYREEIYNAINEIIKIDLNDGASFKPIGYRDIMETKEFDGIRVNIKGKLFNFVYNLSTDIMVVDDNTHFKSIISEYDSMDVLNDKIKINTDVIENIVSDKISAIINQGIDGTRLRDYYDMYLFKYLSGDILQLNYEELSKLLLSKIKYDSNNWSNILDNIFSNENKFKDWNIYASKFVNTSFEIDFIEIKDIIIEILKNCQIIK